ncbi:FGGY-family carbohydrate kinase [Ferruginibacter sp. SUN106]|uniref:FGGY-family carbohydrate kinase n=1 Tax=Ferruginibacter sp. SUN106 TaxID=2978348 RepID=UPI003D35CBCA
MNPTPVIAIFDVGKTNKKLFLFDEHYRIVYEKTLQFTETIDEDGDPCENLEALTAWGRDSLKELIELGEFDIKALNFSAYGASFVHIDEEGKPVAPLYNYLKPFPEDLKKKFYEDYGGEIPVSMITASPVLGNLNSGMQLYRLKYKRPDVFKKIHYSLHLPQYLSYLITNQAYSDITSIGCHTGLWNFPQDNYHEWVLREGIAEKLAPLYSSADVVDARAFWKDFKVGIGLHDSSSALIPYLACFSEPFVLISTGTWCITLNPFNKHPLTEDELKQDCLCYMSYRGEAVKASRLFAGNEHEIETKRLAQHFNTAPDNYKTVEYDEKIIHALTGDTAQAPEVKFAERNLAAYKNYAIAYHRLILDIMWQQLASTKLVLQDDNVNRIFVDGGFSKNSIYMHLLAEAFPEMEIYAASVAQATSVGAALAIHRHWNTKPLPGDIIDLKFYAKPTIA